MPVPDDNCIGPPISHLLTVLRPCLAQCLNNVLNVKALVGAFNQEKALGPGDLFEALVWCFPRQPPLATDQTQAAGHRGAGPQPPPGEPERRRHQLGISVS